MSANTKLNETTKEVCNLTMNTTNIQPPASSSKKALPSTARKPTIVVRQTLTSKLRAERGDQLMFYKNKLKELTENKNTTLTQASSASKESLKPLDKFKKPSSTFPISKSSQNFKTPICKTNDRSLAPKPSSSATKSITKTNSVTTTTRVFNLSNKRNNQTLTNSSYIKKESVPKTNTAKTSIKQPINKPSCNKCLKFTDVNKKPDLSAKKPLPSRTDPVKKPLLKTTTLNKPKPIKKVTINQPQTKQTQDKPKLVVKNSPMRKSLTAIHFKRVTNYDRNNVIKRTQSWADVSDPNMDLDMFSPIKEEPVFFKTPSAKRRSVSYHTPVSSRKSLYSPMKSTPSTQTLKQKLSSWLERKGKPLGSFHHLRCFGINSLPAPIDEENKENIEVEILDKDSSYKDLRIVDGEDTPTDCVSVAIDALYDLHKLILEGYPRDQCEAWLDLIRTKYNELEDKSQYWECRAALEEARGDFPLALDCYRKAIIKGAEVKNVDESLENLLQKFSVLNISPSKDSSTNDKHRTEKMLVDARNVFKSSIINFAVKEKEIKNGDLDASFKMVATQVRRSTRKSRSHYVSTPGVHICSTLTDLDVSIRDSIEFKSNKALHRNA